MDRIRVRVAALFLLACALALHAQDPASRAEPVDFVRDILPIFKSRCFKCHGPDKQQSFLRLDSKQLALEGGVSGAVILPGRGKDSRLVELLLSKDEEERMPLGREPLAPSTIDLIRKWIDGGADWPDSASVDVKVEKHWAYRPLVRPDTPVLEDPSRTRNPIDFFVQARLAAEGIDPSPEADRHTLIKRLYYDLLGLPPDPAEAKRFVDDAAPDAYDRLVRRLLASPHFGERWGRHWLDKARYADTDGYAVDKTRPDAWRYRDWVINAVNRDLPFDRFTVEQLAGDLVPDATPLSRLATAFHRQTLTNTVGGSDPEEFRVLAVFDRVETTGAVWLGLTVGCARCHNHKYDRVSQREYYRLFAFFNNGEESESKVAVSEAAMAQYRKEKKNLDTRMETLKKKIAEKMPRSQSQVMEMAGARTSKDLPEDVRKILAMEPADRSAAHHTRLMDFCASVDPKTRTLVETLARLKKSTPRKPLMDVRVIGQRKGKPRRTFIYRRGNWLEPTREVRPGVLGSIHPFKPRREGDADRLDLARWLVDPANPLTPRVAANHLWAHLFRRGLVSTVNDFGVQGEPPSHPALLDWLATEYRRRGWSRKEMIRLIVGSATYRQSSRHRPELRERDANNTLLYRQNRFRVEGEIIRDLNLAAGGLLSRKIGGPSVFPPMPAGAHEFIKNLKWNTSEGADRYRRGMYTFFKRRAPYPSLTTFDCPDANTACLQRSVSNTPLQALTMLNDGVFVDAARALARRATALDGGDRARLAAAFRRCVTRPAEEDELAELEGMLDAAREWYRARPDEAKRIAGTPELAAWTATARILLNLDEFMTRE